MSAPAVTYNAKARDSMRRLAMRLMAVPQPARHALAARLMAERIMLPTQWWVRFSVWLAKKRHGIDDFTAWALILTRAPQVADELIGQTANWIVSGKDADGDGVGGLNQREADKVSLMLDLIAGNSDRHPGWTAKGHEWLDAGAPISDASPLPLDTMKASSLPQNEECGR